MIRFFSILSLVPLLAQTQEVVKDNPQTEISKHVIESGTGINWIEKLSWEQIKAKARAENKFIFVDAYTTWCAPCKLMDKNVFPDKAVGDSLNAKFLSVKIQMDETDKDNEKIKSRYVDARYINNNYKPDGYPCFLFFAPNGILVHQTVGYREPDKFIAVINEALTNPIGRYKNEISKFKNRQLSYAAMPELAKLAEKYNDEALTNSIAKMYKEKYLDLLNEKDAFTKENLLFVADFYYSLVTTKDKYFKFFYQQGDKADALMKHPNGKVSELVVTAIIKKEEITDKLYKEGKPVSNPKPNWEEIRSCITKKYGEALTQKYFPEEQIKFYKASNNGENYVKYVNQKIKKIPPQAFGKSFGDQFGDSWGLNNYAWDLFKFCEDKKLLKEGLRWSNESIRLSIHEKNDSSNAVQYFDTKANLLYRLGRKQQAIEQEKIAISLTTPGDAFNKEYLQIVEKMKNGQPTWPEIKK